MLPRRGACRGGRGGRGRGVGCVQPEVQLVVQATDPSAPITHADLPAIKLAKVQGLDYANAGTTTAYSANFCSDSSRTPEFAEPTAGRG